MGGYGSGPYGFLGSKQAKKTVESCYRLDISTLKRNKALVPGASGAWSWNDDIRVGFKTTTGSLLLYYTITEGNKQPEDIGYRIEIDETECNYGNTRPWFICPNRRCGKRVGKLYLRDKYFLCRHCHQLQYTSCQESGDAVKEARRKVNRLKKKVGATDLSWLSPVPHKPKGMHWKTYSELFLTIRQAEWEETQAFHAMAVGLNQRWQQWKVAN